MNNKTKICCLDVDKTIVEYLSKDFEVYDGSLGKKVRLNLHGVRDYKRLLLNCNIPDNLHEFDILIDDMYKPSELPFVADDHLRLNVTGNSAYYFICQHPITLFDQIPCNCDILKEKLVNKKDRPIIKIAFQEKKYKIEYIIENMNDYDKKNFTHSNYQHLDSITSKILEGSKVKFSNNLISKQLYEPFIKNLSYKQTFEIPSKWNQDKQEYIYDEDYVSLLENQNGDIISYLRVSEYDITIMLPQMDNEIKLEFLKHLFNEFLYKHFSEYFPTIQTNAWLDNEVYFLPNHASLLQKKMDNIKNFETTEMQITEQIIKNKHNYGFLHDILTETNEGLVNAVIKYLKWLGFDNIKAYDKIKSNASLFEEDIQIDLGEKGLLIIEVKGIGGTSKDSDCSQINKIKLRRCKERGNFDVYALYIVNNERYKEPLKRTIPPFNQTQIKDAENEERGMIYTLQLFNLFYNIENGIITKENAKDRFLLYGLIDFSPTLKDIGMPYKYYKNNTVICVELDNTDIKCGDYIVYEIDGRFYKQKIVGIQQNKKDVINANGGKTSILIEKPIQQNKKVYLG